MQKALDAGDVRGTIQFALFLFLVFADRLTKIFFSQRGWGGRDVIPGIVSITNHQNYGIIANIPLPFFLILLVTGIAIGLIVRGYARAIQQRRPRDTWPLMLILAGAVGNLWDRLEYGGVYDWILLFGRSAINLADIFIIVGLLWYIAVRNPRPALDVPSKSA